MQCMGSRRSGKHWTIPREGGGSGLFGLFDKGSSPSLAVNSPLQLCQVIIAYAFESILKSFGKAMTNRFELA